jgi:hypothetical protein
VKCVSESADSRNSKKLPCAHLNERRSERCEARLTREATGLHGGRDLTSTSGSNVAVSREVTRLALTAFDVGCET